MLKPQIINAILDHEIDFSFARSSGPGGQNVNKVSSKAVLKWNLIQSPSVSEALRQRFLSSYASHINQEGEVVISSEETRSQIQNKQSCIDKLCAMLNAVATPPKPRRPTKISKGVKKRRQEAKMQHSAKKQSRRSEKDGF
jgi:ribosome-associated protein